MNRSFLSLVVLLASSPLAVASNLGVAVPEGGSNVVLLVIAMSGLAWLYRKLA